MRATLNNAALTRYAGRFVWLELDFDKPVNQPFVNKHGVTFTPTLFVLDPSDEHVTAENFGGLALAEFTHFLERGEALVRTGAKAPEDAALARGDELAGENKLTDAIASYKEALRLGRPKWSQRDRAVRALTIALSVNGQYRKCAETAIAEAPAMARESIFVTVALYGYGCATSGRAEPWADQAQKTLEPLAVEALAVPSALRDERFQLYEHLMRGARLRQDMPKTVSWGERWLAEIDKIAPANDDERSALDIARRDAAFLMNDPARVIPALIASERSMPTNYNTSLRLAEVESAAKQYDEAVAACDRGLAHVTGPVGQAWLLALKGETLIAKGNLVAARSVLREGLTVALTIRDKPRHDNFVNRITLALAEIDDRK